MEMEAIMLFMRCAWHHFSSAATLLRNMGGVLASTRQSRSHTLYRTLRWRTLLGVGNVMGMVIGIVMLVQSFTKIKSSSSKWSGKRWAADNSEL